MNRCDRYENIMQEVLDGLAPPEDREALESHMSRCPACRMEFRSLSFSLDLLASAPVPEPGPDFTARIVQGAFKAGEVRAARWKYFSWCLTGLMVILSALLAAGWTSVIEPAARVGLRGLFSFYMDIMVLFTVFGKLQEILVRLATLMRNETVALALGVGAPAFWGCLAVLCLMLIIFARSGLRVSEGLAKRR